MTFHGHPVVCEYPGSCLLGDGTELSIGFVLVDFGRKA